MDRIMDLCLETLHEGLLSSDKFFGKPIVIFNSASQCGFTHQLEQFQELFEQGKVVPIALPTNEFGSQEPGDNYEICQFAKTKYKVTFPICTKTDLQHTLFQQFGKPSWNFNKYVFDKDHKFVIRLEAEDEPKKILEHV